MTVKELRGAIKIQKTHSAWQHGVKLYALHLLGQLDDMTELCGSPADYKLLLNGAENWIEYSNGGFALICDDDIAERLCSPSELKKNHHGERQPNRNETWLDVQARALFQAAKLILYKAQQNSNI